MRASSSAISGESSKSGSSQSAAWSRQRGPPENDDHAPSSSPEASSSPGRILGTSPVAGSLQWGSTVGPVAGPLEADRRPRPGGGAAGGGSGWRGGAAGGGSGWRGGAAGGG